MGTFFALNCLVISYAVLFLGSEGYTESSAGMLIAGAAVAGCILQFISGRIADRNPKWYWKKQLILFAAIVIVISVLRIIPFHSAWWAGLSYGLMIIAIFLMMPLVNGTSFYYSKRGAKVNFGIIRGIGSVSFAVISYITGFLAKKQGTGILAWITGILAVLFLAAVIIMPGKDKYTEPEPEEAAVRKQAALGDLLKTYPAFFIMAGAIALVLVFHNIVSSYLVRIVGEAGGSSESLGAALAVAAVSELPVMFLYSRIAKLPGASSKRLILVACGFFALRSVMFILAQSVVMIYIVQFLQCVSFALLVASKSTYAEECMKQGDKTTGQAVMSMTDSFGMVAGTLLGGFLITNSGIHTMLITASVIAFAGFGVALIAALKKESGAVN